MLKQFAERIVIVGCGGIGSWLIPPLARFLDYEKFGGQLVLVDGDKYVERNASRQAFTHQDVGRNKAEVQLNMLRQLHPALTTTFIGEYISDENVSDYITERDVVFMCVDNHPARNRIAQHCQQLGNVVLLNAGNDIYDGDVMVTIRRNGDNLTRSVMQRHPEVETITDGDPLDGCEDLIEEGQTQLLVTNLMAATGAVMLFWKLWDFPKGEKLPQEVFFDIRQLKVVPVTA